MNFFAKITIVYLVAVSLLSLDLFFTYKWIVTEDELAAGLSGIAFIFGVWIFYKTLKKIDTEE